MRDLLIEGREERTEQIRTLEDELDSRVLVYFCADSPLSGGKIHEDVLRPMYEHLRDIGHQENLSLFLYSRGGQLEAPWKIVSLLRRFCEHLSVAVPYKAHSAATMIAIGADKIHMGDMAELGPIDPSLNIQSRGEGPTIPDLGVEDVSSYLKFIKERAGLGDQEALGNNIQTLAEHLTPPLLGRLERVSSHIRLVAHQLLSLHKPPLKQPQISEIAKALIEEIYVHGHGIGREQAADLGLDVAEARGETRQALWDLYESYEVPFRLREAREANTYFEENDTYELENVAVACVESAERCSAYVGNLKAQRVKSFPQKPEINLNMQLELPQGVNPQQIPQAIQQQIQQLLQQGVAQLQQEIQSQLAKQGRVEGITASLIGGVWEDLVVPDDEDQDVEGGGVGLEEPDLGEEDDLAN